MEDMLKLKNAKTSTRERLIKTIKKYVDIYPRLNFVIDSEDELRVFCECIENAVLEKHKELRGEYAFTMLVEKLK
jgi:hypothetical protein